MPMNIFSRFQNEDAICLSNYCDIFRCRNYLPSNHSFTEDDLDQLIDIGREFDSVYPDSPTAESSNELIPLQPPELLDILELEQIKSRPLRAKPSRRSSEFPPPPIPKEGEKPTTRSRTTVVDPDVDPDKVVLDEDRSEEDIVVNVKESAIREQEEMLVRRGTKRRGFRDEIKMIFDSMEEYVEGIRHDSGGGDAGGSPSGGGGAHVLEDEKEIWRPPDDENPEDCDPQQMERLQNECQVCCCCCWQERAKLCK